MLESLHNQELNFVLAKFNNDAKNICEVCINGWQYMKMSTVRENSAYCFSRCLFKLLHDNFLCEAQSFHIFSYNLDLLAQQGSNIDHDYGIEQHNPPLVIHEHDQTQLE